MTPSAIGLCKSASVLALAAFAAMPASAQRNVTDERVDAKDVALTPVQDLNLHRDPIPPVLERASAEPYANPGLSHCTDIRREIGDLDAVLGDDLDAGTPERRAMSVGKIAQRVVASLIPYRSVIRELSGAEKHELEFREAISAGLVRRAYLKGLGHAMDCPYPARPMPAELRADLKDAEPTDDAEQTEGEPVFVSVPVIQPAGP